MILRQPELRLFKDDGDINYLHYFLSLLVPTARTLFRYEHAFHREAMICRTTRRRRRLSVLICSCRHMFQPLVFAVIVGASTSIELGLVLRRDARPFFEPEATCTEVRGS